MQYSPYVLRLSPPPHIASFPFDKIAFKMDLEELNARMKKTRMNHRNSNETASRLFPGNMVKDIKSLPSASSSNNVTARTQPRTNTYHFFEVPMRRSDEGPRSSSTRRVRRSHMPKHCDQPICDRDSTAASCSAPLSSI